MSVGERSDLVVRVDHLTKRYGTRTVVCDLNFKMQAGDVVAILGPNGAGKTTSLGLLEGFLLRKVTSAFWDMSPHDVIPNFWLALVLS